MIVAINTRFWLPGQLEGVGYFTQEVVSRLAQDHPEHQFYFIFDRPPPAPLPLPPNAEVLVLPPAARHPVLWTWWFNWKLPAVLRKIKADVFVSLDGYASLRTRVPQCLVVHDLGFLHQPGAYKKVHLRFLRRNLPRFLQKARRIATVSEFSKNDIIRQYGIPAEKIRVVYSAVKQGFSPISYEAQAAVKEKFTGGSEFFLYVGAIQPRKNLVALLKAFSIFKRRLKSGMKLVLAGRMAWMNDEFQQLLGSYKYRDDVVLTHYLEQEELSRLVASAYALVYPSLFEGFGVPVLEGMQSGVPVLTSQGTSMQEIGGDAALYFDATRHEDIADKLMLIYKDETLRDRLIRKGTELAPRYSWQRTADLLWESVNDALAD